MDRNFKNTYVEDESTQFRDFSNPSYTRIGPPSLAGDDVVYKGVTTMNFQSVEHVNVGYSLSDEFLARPSLKKDESNFNRVAVSITGVTGSSKSSGSRRFTPSELPDLLVGSHFEVQGPLDNLVASIERVLNDAPGVSFDFDASKCEWKGASLKVSIHCKFQIVIYDKSCAYIVEGNRLMGDASAFRLIFSKVKGVLISSPTDIRDSDSFSASMPLVQPVSNDDSEEHERDIESSLENIFRMAHESYMEPQLEASKIICDSTLDADKLHILVDHGVLGVLKELITSPISEWAQQHAVVALANISNAKTFQDAIIKEGLLPPLLKLACDGPYHTGEMRRIAVHILANLCEDCASGVANALGRKEISTWMTASNDFSDERLKIQARRAREYLGRIVFAS